MERVFRGMQSLSTQKPRLAIKQNMSESIHLGGTSAERILARNTLFEFLEGPKRHLDAAGQKLLRDSCCLSLTAPLPSLQGCTVKEETPLSGWRGDVGGIVRENLCEGICESKIAARQWGVNFCREALRCLAGPSGLRIFPSKKCSEISPKLLSLDFVGPQKIPQNVPAKKIHRRSSFCRSAWRSTHSDLLFLFSQSQETRKRTKKAHIFNSGQPAQILEKEGITLKKNKEFLPPLR